MSLFSYFKSVGQVAVNREWSGPLGHTDILPGLVKGTETTSYAGLKIITQHRGNSVHGLILFIHLIHIQENYTLFEKLDS